MKKLIIKRTHSRRQFITKLIGAGIIINLPFVYSCNEDVKTEKLNLRQKDVVDFTLEFLYPNDDIGPNIQTIGTYSYLLWMLDDKNVDPDENKYILNGINWVDETAVEEYDTHFEKLGTKQKYKLLKKIVDLEWGENWLSKMLTVIIESMFADPIYGSNPKGIVWEWINHNPGQPRPDDSNKYPVILNRKTENIIITSFSQL